VAALQLYGRKKCRETQKGERWLKERRVEFHFIDLDVKAPGPAELDSMARANGGVEVLVDTTAALYKKKGYAYLEVDLRSELLEHPELIRTPILRKAPAAQLGFDEARWKALVES
jgi:arsenate reductase-like glutaredoxin family protein